MKAVGVIGLLLCLPLAGLAFYSSLSLQASGIAVGGPAGNFLGQMPLIVLVLGIGVAAALIIGVAVVLMRMFR